MQNSRNVVVYGAGLKRLLTAVSFVRMTPTLIHDPPHRDVAYNKGDQVATVVARRGLPYFGAALFLDVEKIKRR